mmetsp:Transcript_132745/g.383782  ORF Transcript_132745/g.383782 Transcript_132745/m.383782 type:complete len:255 (-) Transcript_132745:78-842(-)
MRSETNGAIAIGTAGSSKGHIEGDLPAAPRRRTSAVAAPGLGKASAVPCDPQRTRSRQVPLPHLEGRRVGRGRCNVGAEPGLRGAHACRWRRRLGKERRRPLPLLWLVRLLEMLWDPSLLQAPVHHTAAQVNRGLERRRGFCYARRRSRPGHAAMLGLWPNCALLRPAARSRHAAKLTNSAMLEAPRTPRPENFGCPRSVSRRHADGWARTERQRASSCEDGRRPTRRWRRQGRRRHRGRRGARGVGVYPLRQR